MLKITEKLHHHRLSAIVGFCEVVFFLVWYECI